MTQIKVRFPKITFRINGETKSTFIRRSLIDAKRYFRDDYRNGVKTGRVYGSRQASAEGEYPARKSGRLGASIKINYGANGGTISSNLPYAGYLISGTRHMRPRKMFYEALNESLDNNIGRWSWVKIRVSR